MRTPKHWKHMFFCKGTCFLRKKKAPARNARNRRPNGVFFWEKKAPARNAWNRRPIGVPNLVRQITYFLEIVDLVSKKKFKPPSRWSISIISCGLNFFFDTRSTISRKYVIWWTDQETYTKCLKIRFCSKQAHIDATGGKIPPIWWKSRSGSNGTIPGYKIKFSKMKNKLNF